MPNRFAIVAALSLLACVPAPERADEEAKSNAKSEREPEAKPETSSEPAPTKVDAQDYSSFGMPPAGRWSLDDYTAARKAINAIAKQDPKLLPRDGSPTFEALADVEHLAKLGGGIPPSQIFGLSLSLSTIRMVYGDQISRDPEFEREWLILSAAVLAVTAKLPVTGLKTEAEAAALRDEPSRLEGLLRYRHGIHEMVQKLVDFEPKSTTVTYGFACTQLARVIDDASALMLSEERAAARTKLEACASAGADPKVVEQLERALAEDAPTAPMVTALEPEHREYAGD